METNNKNNFNTLLSVISGRPPDNSPKTSVFSEKIFCCQKW